MCSSGVASATRRRACEPRAIIAPGPSPYLDEVRRSLAAAGLEHEFSYEGELDRPGKLAFLRELDVLSVPATYDEPKGLFLIEAMASGVPVVQPRRGAFVEVVEKTGGGLLVAVDDPQEPGRRPVRAVVGPVAAASRSAIARSRACASTTRSRGRPIGCSTSISCGCRPCGRSECVGGVAMLDVSHVSKDYATPRGPLSILSDVSFSLAPGEAAAITGPSGSGKSSLLYVLGALEPPTRGTVTLGRAESVRARGGGRRGLPQP